MDRLNVSVRRIVDSFCKEIINVYGNQLKSITVYGSVLGKFFNPKKSDINLLIILDSIDLAQLKKCLPIIKKYGRRINPLLVTREYIKTSQDVYPMEFLEMKENYLVIYGEDVLCGIDVDRQYLRLECEQQLKGSLLKLRQGFLRLGLTRGGLERLIGESISSIFVIFRNLIRIKGEEPPVDRENIIERMVSLYNLDKDTFINIMGHKELEIYFDRYLKGLEILIGMVDKL